MCLKQEDYNSMMRFPWESSKQTVNYQLNKCPQCGFAYCGDGKNLCTECEAKNETPPIRQQNNSN